MTSAPVRRLHEHATTDGTAPLLEALMLDGAVIVHDLVDPALLAALDSDLRAAADGRAAGTTAPSAPLQQFWGERTMRFTRLPERSTAFLQLLTNPTFLAVADTLLLPHCTSHWLNTGQAIFLAPGQTRQQLHRDADNWFRINRPDGPELTVSCMIAIDNFTEDNGATSVVPCSHTWPDFARRPDASEPVVQAVMPAGSGLIYTGRVLHGGGENRSSMWRRGLHISFVVGWLTPEEAVPLGVSWATVRNEPPRVQQLLGWRSTTLTDGGGRLWTVDYDDVPVGLGLI
ncbi:MAG TPA: phytanoyl-CoA dioxygenase family protein [Acidimicrobiia bacterium]|nr:phytanoyl-CoA dioxygenase family protein [Acidimicrobiia bacterium]